MSAVTISKQKIENRGGVVILPLKEYQKLCEKAVPTYYLTGQEAKKLDELVGKGLKERRQGKTQLIKSLADLE